MTIHADPERIHGFVGDLRKWEKWGPWKEEAPSLVTIPGGKTSGLGSSQPWVGTEGDGSLTLTMCSSTQGIEYNLFFDQGTHQCWAAVYYTPSNVNDVFWSIKGDMTTQVFGGYLTLRMDSMVVPMFERGLEILKTISETL